MSRAAGLAVAATIATIATACGSGSSGSASVGTQPSGLRGVPVTSVSCRLPATTPRSLPVTVTSVTSLVLCPLRIPTAGSGRVTLHPGSAIFHQLLVALAKPSEPRSHDMCQLYADVPQMVLATTSSGTVYLITIPVDGCGHYLPAALGALNHARAVMPRTGPPAVS